ncbi:MAG TPA: rod shape-determining protein MreC [Clostridia bacterium]|nr:rod shape-determining protein MreC [Clostridia bacterium]HPQ47573.1 rod shape-determining protein MreC [Clostridia bacterium]
MIKLLKNRKFQIALSVIALLFIILLSVDRFSKVNIIRNIVTAPVVFVQKGVKAAGDWFGGIISGIRGYKDVIDLNNELKDENLDLRQKVTSLTQLEEENQRLRTALGLKDKFSEYDVIGANIVGSNPGNFYYNFRIDAGSLDGVVIDAPVVAGDNVLVGRVYSVDLTSAVIIPMIDEKSGISVWNTKSEGGQGIVKGDIELKEQGKCLMDTISEEFRLQVGDVIETSGIGSVYPRGILVGVVEKINREESLIERNAIIEPLVNFNEIREVYILVEKDRGD